MVFPIDGGHTLIDNVKKGIKEFHSKSKTILLSPPVAICKHPLHEYSSTEALDWC